MKPVLLNFGSIQIYSFGVMVATGVLIAVFLMNRVARRKDFPAPDQAVDFVFTVLAGGFLGARILYVIQHWSDYRSRPLEIFAFWEGGLIFYGGLIGAVIALVIFLGIKRLPFLPVFDFLAPYVAFSHAFGRLGCFLNGCCGGKPANVPWAFQFPGDLHPSHPAQLYEFAFNISVFIILRQWYERKRFQGEIILAYFGFYGIGRFLIEFVRSGNPYWGLFTINQWLSLALIAAASLFFLTLSTRERRNSDGI